jgi:[acyl-carrier-protein] S-malonyltransferase
MKKAFVFPGQGSQFVGMAKDIMDEHSVAKNYLKQAEDILGFDLASIMFNGPEDRLLQTSVTQPAIFVHSVLAARTYKDFKPDAVAGHSLGEFSALVAAGVLSFEDGLRLVQARANAMQKACDEQESGMAAIIGLDDEKVEEICNEIDSLVVPANYNTTGQVVISGTIDGIEKAIAAFQDAGARMAIKLKVNGAFHSPLMKSAEDELAAKIKETSFQAPICPIYQNVVATAISDIEEIKTNLIKQLTAPVRWTQTIKQMKSDGFESFEELGPGKVLSGLIRKIR